MNNQLLSAVRGLRGAAPNRESIVGRSHFLICLGMMGAVLVLSGFALGVQYRTEAAVGVPTSTSTSAAVVTATLPPDGFAPPVLCTDTNGQVIDFTFDSLILQGTMVYRVYLPPCYWETNRRYPYVILFHGAGADQTQWTQALGVNQALDRGIANGRLAPMLLVMPNGGDLQNTNIFTDGTSFESLILGELMPQIERSFCTWNEQAGRAIGGISRGGFWAYEIGLRHPTLFAAIGGHSAFFDPTNAPPANNPLNLAQTVQFTPGMQPRLWLDAGPDDSAHPDIDLFAQTLWVRHINPGYVQYSTGDHSLAYWAAHISDYLEFYGQTWPHDPALLARCRSSNSQTG